MISIILSSRSCICSSVSPSLLLIPSSTFFILVIVFFSSDWLFVLFFNYLLKFSLCSPILFPNSVSILIINVLNSSSDKWFISVSLVFQSFLVIVLSMESNSSVFSFFLTFYISIKSSETVTYCNLEGVSLFGSILIQSVCAQWLWWERWI